MQIGFAYPDFVSAQAATVAVLAALMRRDATGVGARIEVWQYAMALACLGPTVVAAELSGDAPGALGNRAEGRAPHALYPARGDDRWVAVSVQNDAMWDALCRVPGLESLGTDPRFATLALRLEHQDDLDDLLAAWTGVRTDWEGATGAAGRGRRGLAGARRVGRRGRPSARRARFLPRAPARAVPS